VCGTAGWDPTRPSSPGPRATREAPLPGTHDLGADPPIVPLQEGVVDATGAAGVADLLVPPPSNEHPFMQPLPGVTEVGVAALTSPVPNPSGEIENWWT
jgi:hypothetical protein